MMHFLRARGRSLALVVVVMILITGLQGGISYGVWQGPLRKFEPTSFPVVVAGFYALRIILLLLLAMLWVLNRKRALFSTIIAANTYFTLGLFVDVISLIGILRGLREPKALLIDAAL